MPSKTIIELGDTTTSNVRGSADTVYRLLPRIWLKTLMTGAKKRFYATQFAYQTELQKGQNDVVIPRIRRYMYSGATWAGSVGEGSDIIYTTLTGLSGVAVTPVERNYGIAISNKAVRTNAIDTIRAARENLMYVAGDAVDQEVWNAIKSDQFRADSDTIGTQAIYGGDATQASEVATGDPVTTDMVAAAKRKLQSSICQYWTYGTSESNSSEYKNPWQNETGSPFVLLIAPEQEETFLTDTQFVNASEYGDDSVVKNGEIGKYLGVKIVVANNTPYYAAGSTHADGTTTAVAQHRCAMIKSNKAVALAWGQKTRLIVFDYPSQLEKRLIIEQAYKTEQLYPDAIVHINVSDE